MRLRTLGLLTLLSQFAAGQARDDRPRAPSASVIGVVRDSIARAPLVNAMVQMVDADRNARSGRVVTTDSLGRFSFDSVPDGHYMVGFYHPMLDSLGIEPVLRDVYVIAQRSIRADLAVPSSARLRAAICGQRASESGLIMGVVRDADTRKPMGGITVHGEWVELALRRNGMVRKAPRLIAITGDNGWFAMCNVPSEGSVALRAMRGRDSSEVIEVQIPSEGFLRRELYLTPSFGVREEKAVLQLAETRLSGTVVSADDGRPIGNAQVSVGGSARTRTNEKGEWVITSAPIGTRMLDVRAISFYPEHRPIDVMPGGPAVWVTLPTIRAVLDTIRVTAHNRRARDLEDFERRRRSGMGVYLTAQDVMRRQPMVTSDVFKSVTAITIQNDRNGLDQRLLMHGSGVGSCTPAIFLDGLEISGSDGFAAPGITLEDLNAYLKPSEIAGIEVYTGATAPVQYKQGTRTPLVRAAPDSAVAGVRASNTVEGCGSIVIWRK